MADILRERTNPSNRVFISLCRILSKQNQGYSLVMQTLIFTAIRQKVIIEKPEEEDMIYFVTSHEVTKPNDDTQVNVKRIGVVWDASKSRHNNPNVELEYKTLTEVGRKVSSMFRSE